MDAMIWDVLASTGLMESVVGPGEAAASQGSSKAALRRATKGRKRFIIRLMLSAKTTGAALSARLPLWILETKQSSAYACL